MRKILFTSAFLLLAACSTNNADTFYWHNTAQQADTVPDQITAQNILEQALAECAVETRAHTIMARNNDPVSTSSVNPFKGSGDVVDEDGTDREFTDLPTTYQLEDCMKKRNWVKLKHYYTAPY